MLGESSKCNLSSERKIRISSHIRVELLFLSTRNISLEESTYFPCFTLRKSSFGEGYMLGILHCVSAVLILCPRTPLGLQAIFALV